MSPEARPSSSGEVRPPLLTAPFVLLAVAHTLFGLSFYLFLHLPAFITDLGGTEIDVGLIFGATSAVAMPAMRSARCSDSQYMSLMLNVTTRSVRAVVHGAGGFAKYGLAL